MAEQSSRMSPTEYLELLKNEAVSTSGEDQSAPVNSSDELGMELDLNFDDLNESEKQSEPNTESPDAEMDTPECVKENAQLGDLFKRVNHLLGGKNDDVDDDGVFRPRSPETLMDTKLTFEEIERLVLKFLLTKGSASGRQIALQLCLSFHIVDSVIKDLKQDKILAHKAAAEMGDYEYIITDPGSERAKRYTEECSYFGAAPVVLSDYLEAMAAQSIAKQEVTEEELLKAFEDLIMNKSMLSKLGPAINSGRGMFLFGEPGNGKTSVAERVTKCFGSTIWIPRTLSVDGDIIRLFDPGVHEQVNEGQSDSLFDLSGIDPRWVHIVRPTVIAGGELTMSELEISQNPQTKICEAPLQMKSNCGTLVIDDFGRQRMPVDELLNRWIVPLEKRYDFLNVPSGKKIQVPFDQLIIFSTNLEPKDLVDGAFLRRIPYKIEAQDPTEDEFLQLFELMAPIYGFAFDRQAKEAVGYLIQEHYIKVKRPFRACQPRDLLLQVKNHNTYHKLPKLITCEAFDSAVANYFSVM